MNNAEIFFTIPWKSGMSPYICVWLCVNEISFDLKGSVNVSLMEETRRLGQISSYQRISSLDVVRVKPNKKYKLIFTVIICCLELLCWTRSPFQQHFPDKRDATRYYIFDFIVLIIWEHIDTREIKGLFFFALRCYTSK